MKLFETSRNLPLLEEKAGDSQERKSPEFDPHIWLDFTLDEKIVRRISDICAEIAPESAAHFKGNAASYISKLQALDQKYANNLKNCRQRVFVTGGHAAFSYLAKRYNLEQVALYGMSPDAQPTPKHLIKVMTLARQMNLRAVFFEKNVSRKLANQIAQETGAAALVLNPGASLTKEQLRAGASFIDLMEENLKNLSYGLNCR
jgi:zinc transport system substrate-binding protein